MLQIEKMVLGLEPPWIHEVPKSLASEYIAELQKLGIEHDLIGFYLDGLLMRSAAASWPVLEQALSLPAYFGRNLDALDECLLDLSWRPASGYFIVVSNSSCVWRDEEASRREDFWSCLSDACEESCRPEDPNEHPPRPLHVFCIGGL